MPNLEIVEKARARGIDEVLHFTTHIGMVGVFADGAVHSRDSLLENQYLENFLLLNSPSRARDAQWTGYVNLSLSRVNLHMFNASTRWHMEVWWVVLAFDVQVLGTDEVQFVTTNNAYDVAERAPGVEGFEALFGPAVPWGYYGSVHRRASTTPEWQTTDPQAEVLYPGSLPLDHLTAIYVRDEEHLDEVAAAIAAFDRTSPYDLSSVRVECRPEVFA